MNMIQHCLKRATLLCVGLLLAPAISAQPRFTDVTEEVIPFHLFEVEGIAFGDYNNDGWTDLFVAEAANIFTGGGDRMALLHNGGQGHFVHRLGALPTDLLPFKPRSAHGQTSGAAVFGDYDRDGDVDLYLPLGAGWLDRRASNVLLRNERGVFTDVTQEAGLTQALASTAALWLDYDRDGYLDLYVTDRASVQVAILFGREEGDPSAHNRLYRNNQDGTFTDVSAAAGLGLAEGLKGWSIAAPDLNNDGWPDLYVGSGVEPNRLFINDTQGGFQDATHGEIADPGVASGVAVGDINNDGQLDLFQPTSGPVGGLPDLPFRSLLLLNRGAGQFLDITESAGLGVLAETAVQRALLADLDNDGDLDLVTGRPTFLFLNNGEGLFTEATAGAGLPAAGGGPFVVDYDQDGCLDLVYGTRSTFLDNQFGGVYRNTCNDHHYLRVELVGRASNRNGLGARLNARAGALRQSREVLGGLAGWQPEPVAHFGLGPHTRVDTLEVRWPSGQIDVHTDLPVDQQIRLFEGETGYHGVGPTRWEHTLPDTIALGVTLEGVLQVRPALLAPDARLEQVTADLSAWGGERAVPLALEEDGTYRLVLAGRVVEGLPGQREVTVLIEQNSSAGPTWTQLVHPIQVGPRDPPDGPLPIYVDDLASGWRIEPSINFWDVQKAVALEVIQDGRVALEPRSERPVFRGQAALAVQVDSLLPVAGSQLEVWQLTFRAPEPVAHYRTLRFAFHPGTAQPVFLPQMAVWVNGRHLSHLVLSPEPFWAYVSRTVLDINDQAWHVVELPLDVPGFEAPIESISLTGFLAGTFYLDEIQLLPEARSASATAIVETHDRTVPEGFALAQNYPNPFNPETVIRFALPASEEVELAVYNVAGQKVATLVQGTRQAGSYTVRWDGRDDQERELASGLYLYRIKAGARVETRKLMLLR